MEHAKGVTKNNSIGHYECEPITVKTFNCDAGTGRGLTGLCPATVESELQWKGKELAEK